MDRAAARSRGRRSEPGVAVFMTHAVRDGVIGACTTRSAAPDRNDDVLAARRALAVVVSAQESRRGDGRGCRSVAGRPIGTRRGGHHDARGVDGAIGARTTGSASLDRNDDGLAARRALAVVVSAPERRAGAAMGGRAAAALDASDVGGIPRWSRTTRFPKARPSHARRGRRHPVATTTGSRLGARLAVVVAAPERSRRGDGQSRSTVARTPIGTRRCGLHDARGSRRRDRRTHDEVGGARS